MDNIFTAFWSLTTGVLVIGCFALTWITRRGIETSFRSLKPIKGGRTETYKNEVARWWNSFILYLIPPTWGLGLGALLFNHLEWPKGFESREAVMFFGMICGWLCGVLYKFLVKFFLKKMGATEAEAEEAAVLPPVKSSALKRAAAARAAKDG